MSRKCEICGKGQVSGNAVSHSNRHTRRKWNANIQTVRIAEENGTVRKANVCTKCIKSNKVNRAIKLRRVIKRLLQQSLFYYRLSSVIPHIIKIIPRSIIHALGGRKKAQIVTTPKTSKTKPMSFVSL